MVNAVMGASAAPPDPEVDDGAGQRARRSAAEVRHGSAEEGVATVFACLGLVALIGATLLIGQMGVVVVARHRAQAAADLASLAAAGVLAEGLEAACVEAEQVARRMGSRLEGCAAAKWDVTVTVERKVPIGLFGDRIVSAVARAGPVEE
ncbi:Rv3654c family TadE-like protein [Nocardia sp. NPDC023852]|uniref:Rv3654c family TadE-like protein n=1 Tax=Nocardia sp. NPDC023852 TaxID=3154697 RepID=UPI0033C7DC9A